MMNGVILFTDHLQDCYEIETFDFQYYLVSLQFFPLHHLQHQSLSLKLALISPRLTVVLNPSNITLVVAPALF